MKLAKRTLATLVALLMALGMFAVAAVAEEICVECEEVQCVCICEECEADPCECEEAICEDCEAEPCECEEAEICEDCEADPCECEDAEICEDCEKEECECEEDEDDTEEQRRFRRSRRFRARIHRYNVRTFWGWLWGSLGLFWNLILGLF